MQGPLPGILPNRGNRQRSTESIRMHCGVIVRDFDDLILKTDLNCLKRMIRCWATIRTLRYLMVDQYQDTNTAQFELISILARRYKNLCIVGDDDQSIYKFHGANIYNILSFEEHFKAVTIKLEQITVLHRIFLNAPKAG